MDKDIDLPGQSKAIVELPADLREDMRQRGLGDLYYFDKAVLGYSDMTVGAHGHLCTFVQMNPKRFKRMLMPRDHLKTSVITIGGNLQMAVKNPNHRILIGNESATNSERMLRGIRQHCESNRMFRALYGHVIPKDTRKVRWNDSELDFVRQDIFPEPTFDTIGMTGSVTSRHYSHMCFDDPISEEAVKSEKVMYDVINRMKAITSLLTDATKDTVWLVGTRWALFDVYSWFDSSFPPEWLGKFSRSVITPTGDPIWLERFPLDLIALKRKIMGEYKFSCLMMNNPRNAEKQILPVDQIRYWEFGDAKQEQIVLYDLENLPVQIIATHKLDITICVDPAPAEKITSDFNAITVLGMTPEGQAIVLEAILTRCDPLALIDLLFDLQKRWRPRVVGIESVAYQKMLKYFVKNESTKRNEYINVVDLKGSTVGKSKDYRIKGLQPMIATGRLFLHKTQQSLIQQLSEYPLGEHDDGPDSLSMHAEIATWWYSNERVEQLKAAERAMAKEMTKQTKYLSSPFAKTRDEEDEQEDLWFGNSFHNVEEVTLDG